MAQFAFKPFKTIPKVFLLLALLLTGVLQAYSEELTVSSTAADWGYENGSVVSTVTIGDFTLSFSKGTGNNAPAYYTSDSTIRFYVGNTITITSNNSEYKPTKIGDYKLVRGSYTFPEKVRFSTITITYTVGETGDNSDETAGGDFVNNVLIENIYYNIDGFVASVVGCEKSIKDLIIPSEIQYNGHIYSVAAIGQEAFQKYTGLTTVEIPSTVTEIGASAFSHCTDLASVNIPNSVIKIDYGAFYNCKNLTSVTIPDSVTSIGSSAFAYCTGLTTINIPSAITSIKSGTFESCSGLTSVIIPNSVTQIGAYAFAYCSGLTEIIVPNSVISMGNYAFQGCTGLTKVTIGGSVTSIGLNVFDNCSNISELILEDGETELVLSEYSFYEVAPKTLYLGRNINVAALSNNANLTNLTIGSFVTNIVDEAFSNCTGLTEVIIPNSVISIGDFAFSHCTGMTSVSIGSAVTLIGKDAFVDCTGLTEVVIPNSVTKIGGAAFSGCSDCA